MKDLIDRMALKRNLDIQHSDGVCMRTKSEPFYDGIDAEYENAIEIIDDMRSEESGLINDLKFHITLLENRAYDALKLKSDDEYLKGFLCALDLVKKAMESDGKC